MTKNSGLQKGNTMKSKSRSPIVSVSDNTSSEHKKSVGGPKPLRLNTKIQSFSSMISKKIEYSGTNESIGQYENQEENYFPISEISRESTPSAKPNNTRNKSFKKRSISMCSVPSKPQTPDLLGGSLRNYI